MSSHNARMAQLQEKLNVLTALSVVCTVLLSAASWFVCRWIESAEAQTHINTIAISVHDSRISVNEARYQEILRRLDSIDRSLEREKR